MFKAFSMAMCLNRIARALEDIASHLKYQNERSFPPVQECRTEGKPVRAVFSRRTKPGGDDAA